MRRIILATMMLFITLAQTGCGDHHHERPTVVTQIVSDPAFDGDIERDVAGVFTITQGNSQTVFAGIDPFTLSEFRAFLDFPLSGPGGVPANAAIVSATLDIVIDNIQPLSGAIPIRIDLVTFQTPLVPADFDRDLQPPLATTFFSPISAVDVGNHVFIDVTSLMAAAQSLGLVDFQVRIFEDFGALSPGLIEIDDTTGPNRINRAPVLTVTHF